MAKIEVLNMKFSEDFVVERVLSERTTICGDNVTTKKKEEWILKKYFGDKENVIIPDKITSIAQKAFEKCETLKSITFPKSVRSVCYYAFYGCTNLEMVVFNDGLRAIHDGAFFNCKSLKSVHLPESIHDIGSDAFAYCENLENITVLGKLTEFNFSCWAFHHCKPKQVFIPYMHFDFIKYFKEHDVDVFEATLRSFVANCKKYPSIHQYWCSGRFIYEGYESYLLSQKKKLLPMFFQHDWVEAMEFYAKSNKITAKDIDETFLKPAKSFDAVRCVEFLENWKAENL